MIHPFGILLIISIMKNTILKKNKGLNETFIYLFSLLVVLELFVNAGFMFNFKGTELFYEDVVLILLMITSFFIIMKESNRIKIKGSLVFLILSLIITEVFLVINPITEIVYRNGEYIIPEFSIYSIFVLSKILIMLSISVSALQIMSNFLLESMMELILKFVSIIYVILGIEWFTKNILNSEIYHTVINFIFGKGIYTVDFLLERGTGYSLQGLSREPAHLAFGLFLFLIILVFSNIDIKTKNNYFFIGLTFLVLGGSLSGVGYAAALYLIYLIHSNKKLKPVIILLLASIMAIFIIPNDFIAYYGTRIVNGLNVFFDREQAEIYTSEYVRLFSITETINTIFIKRPLFGGGLGIPYAYSFIIMILSSVGISGFIFWFWYYFISIGKVFSRKKISIIFIMFIALIFIGSIRVMYSAFTLLLAIQMKGLDKKRI